MSRYYVKNGVHYGTADEMIDLIEELEAKLAKAVELVERAFNEGVGEGMNDFTRSSGGKTWYDSRSRKRLAELTGGKDGNSTERR